MRSVRSLPGVGLCVALLFATGCGSEIDAPLGVSCGEIDPERAVLLAVIEAERSVALRGSKKTVHGEPGRHRETEFRVWRPAGGPTVLEWQAGGAPTGRAFRYDDRHAWFERPELLLANYRVSVEEEGEPVAWRPTRRIRITGREPGRPSLELLCDAEHGVILREQFRDPDGRVRLTSGFETIAFDAEGPSSDDPGPPPAEPLAPAEADAPPGFTLLVLAEPPPGFVQVGSDGDADETVSYWSDGLAAFLVRQTRSPSSSGEGSLRYSERQGRGTLEGRLEGLLVEITGYLDRDRLEAVARSLRAR